MRSTIFIILVTIIFSIFAYGQTKDKEQTKRPKIGLVLSGGGARGFAHVGVIRVLEENRVPVDYISGASMGGLVGSLYASGRTPDEMEEIIENIDWAKLLSGRPPFDEITYRRKQDRRNIPSRISLSGKKANSLDLPSSLNPGHEIGLLIDNLMLPYSTIKSFDEFPIPFRCVGTDMVNAKTVVLKDGSIQQALRATMAIPAVFAPVEIDGKILSDGGILNNIPTDVAKEMGADILLVVNIETQLGDRENLQNLISILGQTISVATVENSRRSLRQADLIIAPDLQNYTSADFEAGAMIIKLGYEGAKKKSLLLKSLSLNESDWQAHLANRRKRIRKGSLPIPEFLAVKDSNSSKDEETIKKSLTKKHLGKPVDKKTLEKDLTAITGTRKFDRLGYEIEERNGKKGLVIRDYDSKERSEQKAVLQLGVQINNTDSDETDFIARGRLTLFDIGSHGSEWRNDFSIGSETSIGTEYFRPFSNKSKFFVAPNALYQTSTIDLFQNGNRLAEYTFRTAQIGVDFGYSVNRNSELRFGYKFGNQRAKRRIGNPLLPELDGNFSVVGIEYNLDTTDSSQIPTRGIRMENTLNYYFKTPGGSVGFPQARTSVIGSHLLNERYLLVGFGSGGTSFRKTVTPFQQFTVGGLFNVGGFGRDEFRGTNLLTGGVGILRETYALPSFIGGKIYLGGWTEAGDAFETFDSINLNQSFTGGALMESPLGPIFIGGSFAEGGRRKFYFSLGRFF